MTGVTGGVGAVIISEGLHVDWHALTLGCAASLVLAATMSGLMCGCITAVISWDGVYGHSFWGFRRFVRWPDIVQARSLKILNLPFLRLYAASDQKVTWLALFQARPSEFREEIQKLAPPGNPILTHLGQ